MNVFDAAASRIDRSLDLSDRAYVSFSGGKDSGVLLNLVAKCVANHQRHSRLGVLIVDLEAQYQATIDYIHNQVENLPCPVDLHWVCLPINLRNSVSVYEPYWTAWDPDKKSGWVRNPPNSAVTDEQRYPFFRRGMEFEQFTPAFADWYADGQSTACFVGIRTQESLNRWRTIHQMKKETKDGLSWTTMVGSDAFNSYPIYDWTAEDVWTANGRYGWLYNKIYDKMYYAGLTLNQMRLCQPYGDDQRIGLELYRQLEPQMWAKLVGRVSGANFGNIYCGTKALGFNSVELPPGHTWKSYTKLLLRSLPAPAADNYRKRFVKFIQHWRKHGSPVKSIGLPPQAFRTGACGNRSKFELVRYTSVPDALPGKLDSLRGGPSWRRMAMCVIKNDHLCKGLGFNQTVDQYKKTIAVIERYNSL